MYFAIKGASVAGMALAISLSGSVASAQDADLEAKRLAAMQRLAEMSIQASPDRLVQYAAQGDITVVKVLLAAGVPVDAGNEPHKATALHNAAAQGHEQMVQLLLSHGAAVDAVDARGGTPLANAALYGRIRVAEMLIKQGASVKALPGAWQFPLLSAVYSGKSDMVALLLRHGAPLVDATPDGVTALQAARVSQRAAIVDILSKAAQP